jgi:hypothetical protein
MGVPHGLFQLGTHTHIHTHTIKSLYRRKHVQQYLSLEELPLVFHDAVIFSHTLCIPYLWIDALCIIQDDEADNRREIKKMSDIYSGALCDFGAIATAEKKVGLIYDSDNRLSKAFPVVL